MLDLWRLARSYRDPRVATLTSNETLHGVWAPSSLHHLYPVFRSLVSGGVIDTGKWFCDTGCGDMRVGASVTQAFAIPTIGVEFDAALVETAKRAVQDLRRRSILGAVPVVVAHGDFTNTAVYERAGVRFGDIGTFYNYETRVEDLARKIQEESPPGTVLLYCPIIREGGNYVPMEFVGAFDLRRRFFGRPHAQRLYVYRKPSSRIRHDERAPVSVTTQ